jgi:hypothetical protein
MTAAMRAGKRPIVIACLLFLLSCSVETGGLFSHSRPGDTATYSKYGRALVDHGRVPYKDFYDEYPPGSVPVFALPAVIDDAHYVLVFKLWMTLCGLGLVVCTTWTLRHLGLSYLRLAPLLAAPFLMGPVFMNRYDPLAALIVSLALVALLRSRERLTGALLGIGTVVKVYPAVVVPLVARRVRDRFGTAAAFAVAAAVLFLPFFALAPGGVGYSLWTQLKRHLEIESLGASILLVFSKLGVHRVNWIAGAPGSVDLGGGAADVVGTLSSLLAIGLVLLVAWVYWRGADNDAQLVTAWAAAIGAFTIFAKVFSPQYLTWLVGVIPLAAGRKGLYASWALLAGVALTQPYSYWGGRHGLQNQNWTVWALGLRNALLVAAFVLVFAALRDGSRSMQGVRKDRQSAPTA